MLQALPHGDYQCRSRLGNRGNLHQALCYFGGLEWFSESRAVLILAHPIVHTAKMLPTVSQQQSTDNTVAELNGPHGSWIATPAQDVQLSLVSTAGEAVRARPPIGQPVASATQSSSNRPFCSGTFADAPRVHLGTPFDRLAVWLSGTAQSTRRLLR
ncbi:hypothetical protein K491DRAFT_312672 [Lophiostoma macrostomum CBS 122681]|uniref:Uncharacterized protein n=1 Tax=Lophiostoma macrostomum CBS 122681 TaxID=1314788 RepID=A0A6A6TEH6_9PLEO|nr:hypothetical protein K491DRAFT_312672 [Lophiostoma macrostomum CBS 122681]